MNVPEVWNFFSSCSGFYETRRVSWESGQLLNAPHFNMKLATAQDQCSLKTGNLMIGLNSPPERDVL